MKPTGLFARDSQTRRDALRTHTRRCQQAAGVTGTHLAEVTGHRQQVWARMQTEGERASIPLCDLGLLVEELGREFLAPWAEGAGLRLVPDLVDVEPGAVLATMGEAARESGEMCAVVSRALADGVFTPSELAEALQSAREAQQALADLVGALEQTKPLAAIGKPRGRR